MREKRGQAAMEFLMTYGWAILAAVIVIGVLASFGVFSPGDLISDSCILNPPFGCVDNQIIANSSGITFVMSNGLGKSVTLQNITIDGCGSRIGGTLADGDTEVIYIECASLPSGTSFKGDVSILYLPSAGDLNLTASGSINVKVP